MNQPDILHEDKDIIVCRKPAGLPVQSARLGQMDMASILNNYLGKAEIHVVHRLDQPVEGVVVFAKTKKAAAALGKQITDGSMTKIYRAVCCAGETASESTETENGTAARTLVDYLVKDGRTNTSRVAEKGAKNAKRAELSYRILAEKEMEGQELLLVEVELKTGRHHQIRVQMAHAGLPLYGDRKYNGGRENDSGRKHNAGQPDTQLALCAARLSFRHPVSGKRMTFEAVPENNIFKIFED